MLCGALALAAGAEASCPILPGERRFDFRVSDDGRQVELRPQRSPAGETPVCILQLACEVRRKPLNMSYALRRGSIVMGDIVAVEFYFPDGSSQSCRVTEARAPQ